MDIVLIWVLVAVVVLLGLAVLVSSVLRLLGALNRLSRTAERSGARFGDATGLLRARRAALGVLIAQRKSANTDSTDGQVPSPKGRQESDLIG